jgi:hypothetical protein
MIMGQYQQWLHHQEIGQQFQADLEALEAQLASLQEQASELEQNYPGKHNQVIQALAIGLRQLSAQPTPADEQSHVAVATTAHGEPVARTGSEEVEYWIEDASPLQPALFARGNLPNFSTQPIQVVNSTHSEQNAPQGTPNGQNVFSSIPHSEMVLLPEDMAAILDQHGTTDPRVALPHWQRYTTPSASVDTHHLSANSEKERTDELVQRWRERWRRDHVLQQQQKEDSSHG